MILTLAAQRRVARIVTPQSTRRREIGSLKFRRAWLAAAQPIQKPPANGLAARVQLIPRHIAHTSAGIGQPIAPRSRNDGAWPAWPTTRRFIERERRDAEKHRARGRKYYAANREKILKRQRDLYQANREKIRERQRIARALNIEKHSERARLYRKVHREEINARACERYAADPKKYREDHRRRCKLRRAERNARKRLRRMVMLGRTEGPISE
jgi:hypothetical protein